MMLSTVLFLSTFNASTYVFLIKGPQLTENVDSLHVPNIKIDRIEEFVFLLPLCTFKIIIFVCGI